MGIAAAGEDWEGAHETSILRIWPQQSINQSINRTPSQVALRVHAQTLTIRVSTPQNRGYRRKAPPAKSC